MSNYDDLFVTVTSINVYLMDHKTYNVKVVLWQILKFGSEVLGLYIF